MQHSLQQNVSSKRVKFESNDIFTLINIALVQVYIAPSNDFNVLFV